ncbi:hypothetical protein JMS36_004911 [Salmonella enterica]|nr:hypothetical protein [Salmonella enterica]
MKNIIFIILSFVFVPIVSAECYINKRGDPTCVSSDGGFYATFASGIDNIRRIYLIPQDLERCGKGDIGQDDSIYINNVKVRMVIDCSADGYVHYHPMTKKRAGLFIKTIYYKEYYFHKIY